jgi:hypothetical protein
MRRVADGLAERKSTRSMNLKSKLYALHTEAHHTTISFPGFGDVVRLVVAGALGCSR